eukprot:4657268-Prymnesium_polylepis.1
MTRTCVWMHTNATGVIFFNTGRGYGGTVTFQVLGVPPVAGRGVGRLVADWSRPPVPRAASRLGSHQEAAPTRSPDFSHLGYRRSMGGSEHIDVGMLDAPGARSSCSL